jgi:hypothetical protein
MVRVGKMVKERGFGPAPHQTGAAKNPMARANSMKPPNA